MKNPTKKAHRGGGIHQQNPEQIFSYLKSVKGNISRIKNIALMVNSLEEQELDIHKVSRLCKPIRIMQIFQQVMDNFIPYSEFKGIEINYFSSCSEKTCVSVFPLFLETVFTNLIDNAVKYSVENGKISINIEYNEQKSELVYQVSNFSENILGQNLETLFSLGARGKNQGVPPQVGSAVPGFRALRTPLLAQQPPAAPPLPNAGKLGPSGA